jgi:hypothetical protein
MNGRFMNDDFDSVSVPLFTTEERCNAFGSGHGYDKFFKFSDKKSLAHFLQQAAANQVAYVFVDSRLAGPNVGAFPIADAVRFLLQSH